MQKESPSYVGVVKYIECLIKKWPLPGSPNGVAAAVEDLEKILDEAVPRLEPIFDTFQWRLAVSFIDGELGSSYSCALYIEDPPPGYLAYTDVRG